jgi:hypothetical protein
MVQLSDRATDGVEKPAYGAVFLAGLRDMEFERTAWPIDDIAKGMNGVFKVLDLNAINCLLKIGNLGLKLFDIAHNRFTLSGRKLLDDLHGLVF